MIDGEFGLGSRYVIHRRLGRGGYGDVYLADDRELGTQIAIKRLRTVAPSRLLQFKQEFRLLADLAHPNLIQYHELLHHEGCWYLTMEYVQGVNFRDFVHGRNPRAIEAGETASMASVATSVSGLAATQALSSTDGGAGRVPGAGAQIELADDHIERLRAALPQLVDGMCQLHEAGVIHRDIKPSNVLVSDDGRLVILDFGLAQHDPAMSEGAQADTRIAGTVDYMSPEQLRGERAGPAGDFFAVGVMLFESLIGVPPYTGSRSEVIQAKRRGLAVDPAALGERIPDDLRRLTLDLLAPDMDERPSGEQLRERFVARPSGSTTTIIRNTFVGREVLLADLVDDARGVRNGEPQLSIVSGASGMGKSALVDAALRRLRRDHDALILQGRCYAAESLPYKALDGVVDALATAFNALRDDEQLALLPRHIAHLRAMFPVLGSVPLIAESHTPFARVAASEARRRALTALRELLAAMAERQLLVIFVDDIQWGDRDSLIAMAQLLVSPDAPAVHLILAHRDDDDPTLHERLLAELHTSEDLTINSYEVGPLDSEETRRYGELLARRSLARDEHARLFSESQGHPLLVQELVLAPKIGRERGWSLRQLLEERLAKLDADARKVVEVVAVAGRPVRFAWLRAAADLGVDDHVFAQLRALHLLRLSHRGDGNHVTVFHDKVGEVAYAQLSADERVAYHRRLADVIAAGPEHEQYAESLSRHYRAAGARAEAEQYGRLAATRAEGSLAFDRAAAIYRELLSGGIDDVDCSLRMALARALANAGRGAEAAAEFERVATACNDARQLEALQLACGHWLRSGHIDNGIATAKRVVHQVGMRWWRSSAAALLSLLIGRRKLRRRGIDFTERAESDIPADELVRCDALWYLGHGLGGVDTVRGADFQCRHLLRVLDAGEPYRVAKAFAWEAVLAAAEGGTKSHARAWALVRDGRELAQRIDNKHALAWSGAGAAFTSWVQGRLEESLAHSGESLEIYREHCHDVAWEVGSLQVWCRLLVLAYSGRLMQLREECAQAEADFRDRGDLYSWVTLKTHAEPWLHLAKDQPDIARAESRAACERWTQDTWHLQHYCDWCSAIRVALYRGGKLAWREVERGWRHSRRQLHFRLQLLRIFALNLRGQAALAAANRNHKLRAMKRAARTCIRRLQREEHPLAEAYALGLEAALVTYGGHDAQAVPIYRRCAAAYADIGMPLAAAAARLMAIRCGDPGSANACTDVLRCEGVWNPERFATMLVSEPAPHALQKRAALR